MQKYVTTSPDLADVEIVGVRSSRHARGSYHKVETARNPAA